MAGSIAPLVAVGIASAENAPKAGWKRFTVGPQFMFNVSAEFQHFPSAPNPGPGVGVHAVDRVYDNGYVRVDESGNVGNTTWTWGYTDPASVVGRGTATPTLQLQTTRSPADGTMQRESDDPQFGFELGYEQILTECKLGEHECLIGLQGAFGMTVLDIRNHTGISGATTGVQDTYDLSGLPIIPGAPYYGGPPVAGGSVPLLLPDSPATRTSINVPATAIEDGHVDGHLYGFKLGPLFEFPVSSRVAVQISGGFVAMLADTEFSFHEAISTGGTSAGSTQRDEWLFGGFVDGRVNFTLSRRWSLSAGVGYQNVGDYSLQTGHNAVKVRLDGAISGFAGLRYSF